VIEENVEYIQ